jgi:lysophospholipase L1-like esterase
MRECRVYLPLYKGVEAVALGFGHGAKVLPSPVPAGQKPVLFYGTSITQGGCANTAGSDYVSTLGRMSGTEVLNLGFSGNGRGEPEVAKLIREVDAEVFVLDFLANADVGTLEETLPNFIRLLREKRRKAPIAIVSCPAFDQTLWNPGRRATVDRKRDIAMRSYLDLKAAGDNNLFFIDGNGILPAGLAGSYVDGVHPTSHGFAIMAERMLPQLQAIRSR